MSEKLVSKKNRDSNIELLRILLMLGVIALHYNSGFAFNYVEFCSFNYYVLHLIHSIFIMAVDLYVMISGYYLCTTFKRNLWKVVELLAEVIAINLIIYLLMVIRGNAQISLGGY